MARRRERSPGVPRDGLAGPDSAAVLQLPRDGGPGHNFHRGDGGCRDSALARQTLRSEEHTSELQSRLHLVCRLLLEKKKNSDNDDPSPIPHRTNPPLPVHHHNPTRHTKSVGDSAPEEPTTHTPIE